MELTTCVLNVTDCPIDRLDEVNDIMIEAGYKIRQALISSSTKIVMQDSVGECQRF